MKEEIKKKVNLAFVLLYLSIVVTFIIFGRINYYKKIEKFNQLELKGIITYLHSSSSGTKIAIDHSEDKHVLYTRFNYELDRFFYKFAVEGDSIYKGVDEEYVHLFRDEKEYLFEVKKE